MSQNLVATAQILNIQNVERIVTQTFDSIYYL